MERLFRKPVTVLAIVLMLVESCWSQFQSCLVACLGAEWFGLCFRDHSARCSGFIRSVLRTGSAFSKVCPPDIGSSLEGVFQIFPTHQLQNQLRNFSEYLGILFFWNSWFFVASFTWGHFQLCMKLIQMAVSRSNRNFKIGFVHRCGLGQFLSSWGDEPLLFQP